MCARFANTNRRRMSSVPCRKVNPRCLENTFLVILSPCDLIRSHGLVASLLLLLCIRRKKDLALNFLFFSNVDYQFYVLLPV